MSALQLLLQLKAGQLPVVCKGDQGGHWGPGFLHQDTALLLGNVVNQTHKLTLNLSDF